MDYRGLIIEMSGRADSGDGRTIIINGAEKSGKTTLANVLET